MVLSLRMWFDHHRAVIEINPDALSIAETMDKERDEGYVRGPLHGIPFLVKDVCSNDRDDLRCMLMVVEHRNGR